MRSAMIHDRVDSIRETTQMPAIIGAKATPGRGEVADYSFDVECTSPASCVVGSRGAMRRARVASRPPRVSGAGIGELDRRRSGRDLAWGLTSLYPGLRPGWASSVQSDRPIYPRAAAPGWDPGATARDRASEAVRVRSSANLLLAIGVVFVLQAGLCPVLCAARSAEPASAQQHASLPEKAPCHGNSETPSSGEPAKDCDQDCSNFDSAALALPGTCTVMDLLAAAFGVAFSTPLPPAHTVLVGGFEPTPLPPPRNLLLVKNSFLI